MLLCELVACSMNVHYFCYLNAVCILVFIIEDTDYCRDFKATYHCDNHMLKF